MTEITTYQKIAGPFLRSKDLGTVSVDDFVNPAVEMLAGARIWGFSEKIDGTNVRLIWDGHNLSTNGRTNNAQLHGHLQAKLDEIFTKRPGVEEYFEETFGEKEVILVGEGYGAGIQKGGGLYSPTKEFIGYDVMVNGKYLNVSQSQKIFSRLELPHLTHHYDYTLYEIIEIVANGLYSRFGNRDFFAEGVVAQPTEEVLTDKFGGRIIVKVKHVDFFEHPDLT